MYLNTSIFICNKTITVNTKFDTRSEKNTEKSNKPGESLKLLLRCLRLDDDNPLDEGAAMLLLL